MRAQQGAWQADRDFADVLARINDHKITDLAALLPWRWAADQKARKRAA
jgi:hypothetical protein